MSKPIIYLTFANQKDNHLPLLKEEIDNIKDTLRPLETREFLKVEREESTTTEDIIKTLSSFSKGIQVFHYGGHAESSLLQLEDKDAQSKGLAKLLGSLENLKLVFLNGCSTQAQVKELFEAGVKAVIATSVRIQDKMAVNFSSAFYQALATKKSLKRAFEIAQHSLEMQFKDSPDIKVFRGIEIEEEEELEELPWALYLKEDIADELLQWRLPYYQEVGLPKDMISYIGQNFNLNRYIVLVLDEMVKYNKDIYSQMIEVKDGEEVKKDSSEYLNLVIKNFPWVIGSQIRLLLHIDQPNQERLKQLVSLYIITSQVLYFILLSNFWDEKRKRKLKTEKDFLLQHTLHKENLLTFNFLEKVKALHHFLVQEDCHVFVPELKDFCNELEGDTHLAKAWKYLENLRSSISQVNPDTIEKQCITTEQAVAIILRKVAFLADYPMLTIRNISIDNPRYGKKFYELDMGALKALANTGLSLYEDDNNRRKETYANCNSVVLAANEKDLSHTLNLSPFIIDKNTFLNKKHIDLFLYGYEEEGNYYYYAIKHNIYIALQNEKGTDIIDTSMTFGDFQEGRNINKHHQSELDDSGFADAFGSFDQDVAVEEGPKVFALLESQFEQLKTDLS